MIVVCGEALMDVFPAGKTPTGIALDAHVGGSPFNVAVGLARLAQPVAFFGGVSRDVPGERLMRALEDEGVATAAIRRVDAPTTLGLVGLDAAGVPSYAFYGQGGADRQIRIADLDRLPTPIRALHVGSYTTVVEPIGATLRALVERERAHTLICYDPNIRLNVEPDIRRWRDAFTWLTARAHLVKVSEEDLAALRAGVEPREFIAEALDAGVALAVVTRGAAGALAGSRAACVDVKSAPVQVVDTVGAGDTFQAALLTWLAEHELLSVDGLRALPQAALQAAVSFAVEAASITCSRRGADLPHRDQVGIHRTSAGAARAAA